MEAAEVLKVIISFQSLLSRRACWCHNDLPSRSKTGLTLRYEKFKKSCPNYDWNEDGTHLSYLHGKVMREGCEWTEVDQVYCPYNINDNHWIVIIIDLVERKFKICDSMMSRWPPMKSKLSCPKQMVPNLLIKSRLFDEEQNSHLLNGEWGLERVKGLPQQDNGNDCGAYAV